MSTLPKLLLLGDSIRMNYTPTTAELLAGRAEVVGPEDNCTHSENTLANLNRWLGELGTPDVVHWNNGLHDIGHSFRTDPKRFGAEQYVRNLAAILEKLRAAGASVMWATITPVGPNPPKERPYDNDDIARYNAAALELMRREGVPVNDLNAVIAADPDNLLRDDRLHLSPAGMRACGQAVAAAVGPLLTKAK